MSATRKCTPVKAGALSAMVILRGADARLAYCTGDLVGLAAARARDPRGGRHRGLSPAATYPSRAAVPGAPDAGQDPVRPGPDARPGDATVGEGGDCRARSLPR